MQCGSAPDLGEYYLPPVTVTHTHDVPIPVDSTHHYFGAEVAGKFGHACHSSEAS